MTSDSVRRFPPGTMLRLPSGTWSIGGSQRGRFDYFIRVHEISAAITGYVLSGDHIDPEHGQPVGRVLVLVASLDDIRTADHAG